MLTSPTLKSLWFLFTTVVTILGILGQNLPCVLSTPHRILVDTDVDTDDLFAILYLLKLNKSEFDLVGITLSANAWTNAGHAVNQVYDLLHMMGRDDIPVGVGGEGGIREDGTIHSDVGGYFPIIEQGMTTTGECRYRQAIPKGLGGLLDIDSNYGFRKQFLPQGNRRYTPLRQPTSQKVIADKISEGPTTVILIGSHTNFALFLMSNPHLKHNIQHIYIMGGGVRSQNPTGCCPANSTAAECQPRQCGNRGNLFTDYTSNPYAEFNIFADPFASYQVFHSGVPVTLVPLDATNTIPINQKFFETFEKNQRTYEAQYVFLSLKIARDTWFDDEFYKSYFMWDSFTAGVAVSIMRNSGNKNNENGENDFAEMEYMNITVVTSNKPYGISDGSNPFFDNRRTPKFNLTVGGVHSGHVQMGLRDPACLPKSGKGRGKCKDGYTQEISGPDSVRVLVATRAKPNINIKSKLDREFYVDFLEVLNRPEETGRFNFSSQFPYYKEELFRPDLSKTRLGKPVVFDMDMSAGDFLSLFYLLKVPVEEIDLKAIIVSPNGWANAATIDVVYDLLHMMGRDDIPVGLGDMLALNQSDPIFPPVGGCKYVKAVPRGCGGFLDSDTLYGLARDLPRSPRRYTAENSVADGAPRDTDRPELRQPLALEVWQNLTKSGNGVSKITVLTNGPLTSLAKIISSDKKSSSLIKEVYIVGGHINPEKSDKGNIFTVPSNAYAEFNMFLDPLAAKTVLESGLNITLIPLATQRKFSSFQTMLNRLNSSAKTPEARFVRRLLARLQALHQKHRRYTHMDMFLGEILGAVFLGGDHGSLKPKLRAEHLKVIAEGDESIDGKILIDKLRGKQIKILERVDLRSFSESFASRLDDQKQSAVIGSFEEQKKKWSTPPS
ncbi:Ribonucleoside hydrolase-like [Arabidopsis thaliana x Arabidopsis arenosa]|uniref:Ribonucleoside hydrolase-like n=1 Tax=Arabidopsis thaliana x Arabidopsis arenosa TaxID=1240361 RepID=A0A8T1YZN4_9BRAS|nr:Ribonucleoside hydrolase-like [Arabidopsis thaliana x Arabidopsis arenosa]KAG7551170.1 Ribonucleoside hydrolase-like [Arabidopsis thaliana x Arabidopsis arenosa]